MKFRLQAEEGQTDWQHAEQLCDCAELTARFVQDIGGRISVEKTVATSTSAKVSAYVKRRHLDALGGCVFVKLNFRALGAHISLGATA
eukprot:7369076-Alexandrium_andersonii.AAC.1